SAPQSSDPPPRSFLCRVDVFALRQGHWSGPSAVASVAASAERGGASLADPSGTPPPPTRRRACPECHGRGRFPGGCGLLRRASIPKEDEDGRSAATDLSGPAPCGFRCR